MVLLLGLITRGNFSADNLKREHYFPNGDAKTPLYYKISIDV